MIVRDRPRPWELLFIMQGSIVPKILPQLAFITLLSIVITWLDHEGHVNFPEISSLPFSLIGIALSIFSGFRNSASYERWWEARKILGQLVISCRCLSRLAVSYLDAERGMLLARACIAFAQSCCHHFRGARTPEDVLRWLPADAAAAIAGRRSVPVAILGVMSREIAGALRAGVIDGSTAQMMEEQVTGLSAVLAGGERIKTTPLPFAYSLLLQRTVYLFCFLLPFGLVQSAGIWTPVTCAIVAYTFFGLDALGDELAAPFDGGKNALPLGAIARTIEINVLEELEAEEVPEHLVPTGFLLS